MNKGKWKHAMLTWAAFGLGCGEWEGGRVPSDSGVKNASVVVKHRIIHITGYK